MSMSEKDRADKLAIFYRCLASLRKAGWKPTDPDYAYLMGRCIALENGVCQ